MTRKQKHMEQVVEFASAPETAVAGAVGVGALYVVATPIGNLDDLSLRARNVLSAVDLIAAEDTRHTRHLLAHYGIQAKLIAVHEHNEAQSSAKLVSMLAAGQSVALVTDAGTPCISDPGSRLVAASLAAGHKVVPVPGANAAITALSASGIEGPFLFLGFLPAKPAERRRALDAVATQPHTLVFHEAPHRVVESVADLAAVLGGARRLVIARELTKKFESIHACQLEHAPSWLAADTDRQRGEFVLIVSGATSNIADAADSAVLPAAAERTLALLLADLPLKQAVKLATQISGASRNLLYARALELSGEK